MSLIDDGSRFLPWSLDAVTRLERIHRYRWAQQFVANKRVLDIACGEGDGSACLAQTARNVFGVDLDLTMLLHARSHYVLPNLTFIQADAAHFVLAPRSIDVITCFAILEDLTAYDTLLASLQSVLAESGCLLISTPNKQVYTDDANFHNPDQVREHVDQFEALLKRHFQHVRLYGQAVTVGSLLTPDQGGIFLRDNQPLQTAIFAQTADHRFVSADAQLVPHYFVACCSPQPIAEAVATLLLNNQPSAPRETGDYVRQLEDKISVLEKNYTALHTKYDEVSNYAKNLEFTVHNLEKQHSDLKAQYDQIVTYAHGLETKHAEMRQAYSDVSTYARNLETQTQLLETELNRLRQTYDEAVTYARSLEAQAQALGNSNNQMKHIYDEAVSYARSLETKIQDLEENLRQFTDIRR